MAFLGLCTLLVITPGPDTFLVLRYSLGSTASGLATAAGCSLSTLVWALLAGFGIATVLEQSAELYRGVKLLGAAYLIYLGVSSFIKSRKAAKSPELPAARKMSLWSGFSAGALSTILNPKVGLFCLAVVPQFLPHDGTALPTALLLGAINCAVGMAYLSIIAFASAKMFSWLKQPKVTKVIDRSTSGILAALGLGIAISTATEA
ncbi:LysE family efflux protein [Renibacterium salmoninarum ATCC 33209]|uniref:LysE family efflux protein n=1 Tax=Renibacterium salmoninarum (strain ATCC 33209 / DSM 20767 / JCM 11484 / NBRC 15589 / NCIMB 2235) TaxID=288705 RepID=A9WN94_RENSM|nr:LysE family translocator [Renibacterium salmoninarum]ABY23057.1 LysE family efflux protein [Renibacterium salmoninarum ATCC 33209]